MKNRCACVQVEFHCRTSESNYPETKIALQRFLLGHSYNCGAGVQLEKQKYNEHARTVDFVKTACLNRDLWIEISKNVVQAMDLWSAGTDSIVLTLAVRREDT